MNKVMKKLGQKVNDLLVKKNGPKLLAEAAQGPLRLRLDHFGLARRFLVVDPIPPLVDMAMYERGKQIVPLWTESGPIVLDKSKKNVWVPEFRIEDKILLSKSKMPQVVEVLNKKIAYCEMDLLLSLFKCSVTICKQTVTHGLKKGLLKAIRLVERHDLKVREILMNKEMYLSLVRVYGKFFEHEIEQELSTTGWMGCLWGAEIYVNEQVPKGKLYCCAEPERLGVMPMYEDPVIEAQWRGKKLEVMAIERVGMAIVNISGVSELTIGRPKIKCEVKKVLKKARKYIEVTK